LHLWPPKKKINNEIKEAFLSLFYIYFYLFCFSREAQGERVGVVWDGAEGLAGEYGVVGPRVA
jgi:hypothetical protein